VQTRREKGQFTVTETWEQRATVVLRVEKVEADRDRGCRHTTLKIMKNKAGPDDNLTNRIRMTTDAMTFQTLEVSEAPLDDEEVVGEVPLLVEALNPKVLSELPDEFSETTLRQAVAKHLGVGKDNEKARKLSGLLLGFWEKGGKAHKHGRRYRKGAAPPPAPVPPVPMPGPPPLPRIAAQEPELVWEVR
jgi:hypothetical protein